jgi:hypothetical protein
MQLPPAGPAFVVSELGRAVNLVQRFASPSPLRDRVLADLRTLQEMVLKPPVREGESISPWEGA